MTEDILHLIAARAGVRRGFKDARGGHVETPLPVIEAVLHRLGYDVSSLAERTDHAGAPA